MGVKIGGGMENLMISVAMATYNGEQYLQAQLNSILQQSLPVDEIIIVDDCSTDKTVSIIEKYQNEDSRILLFQNMKNLGYKLNFKKALSKCKGDYIFLCDQDDIWDVDKVKDMISVLKEHPAIISLASSFREIDQNDRPVEVKLIPGRSNNNLLLKPVEENALIEMTLDEFVFHNYFQGCSMVIKKELRNKFEEKFIDTLPHDWVLNIIASAEKGMYFYNKPLFSYRIHDKNTIGLPDNQKPTVKQKLNRIFNYDIRAAFAQERFDSLSAIKVIYPEYYESVPEYDSMRTFYKNHLDFLKMGKPVSIGLQNMSPYYKDLKPLKARLMDIFFCLLRKFRLV